jgi:RsiW-degrading membrane proteinase PrsW (M82 family)
MTNYSSFPASTTTVIGRPVVGSSSSPTTGGSSNKKRATAANNDCRGFSTSIADMFAEPDNERIDCCSVTCCGILQTDRDRFLLQGVPPPPPIKRCTVHFMLPVTIFLTAGLAAMHVRDPTLNQVASTALVLALVGYFVLQCAKGRSKRIDIRKDLLWFKYRLQNRRRIGLSVGAGAGGASSPAASSPSSRLFGGRNSWHAILLQQHQIPRPDLDDDFDAQHHGGGGNASSSFLLGQSAHDLGAAHPYCCGIGCYKADTTASKNNCCGYYVQLCGLCAVAQEGRELELLLPDYYRRIDYITMQPMVEYYPAIYRRKYEASNEGFFPSLSKLSVRILQAWLVMTLLILAWGALGPLYWKYVVRTGNRSHAFSLADFGIYLLTFAEAVLMLLLARFLIVIIPRHSSPIVHSKPPIELSTDAIIKYFASGFLLSTSLAVFWELLGAIFLKISLSLILAASGIEVAADPDTDGTISGLRAVRRDGSSEGKYDRDFTTHGASLFQPCWWSPQPAGSSSSGKDFVSVFGQDHPLVYTLYLLLNAFVLAALIEEVCKYFGYRMVEHPDLLSRRDLEQASKVVHVNADDDDEEDDGGEEEEADYFEYDDSQGGQRAANSQRRSQLRQREDHARKRREQTSRDYSKQRQSAQATGASITLAMISVAMGFTCCENLVYIFLYSSSSPRMELYVLMSRTLFPVHPIAAALQSIGVCRRDLEGVPTPLWQLVLPAVLFHGAYDFFILWVDFLDKRHGVYADEGSEQVSVLAVAVSFVVSVLILLTALVHLWRQGRQQRQRLAELDRHATRGQSALV